MNEFLLILAAGLPIVLLFLLVVIFKKPAIIAAPAAFFATIIIALFAWGMPLVWISASFIKGLFVVFEILLIVFGAILLLNILRSSGAFRAIETFLAAISRDRRIQAILIGWFFVSFIEGASGFGTPAVLAAPLLAFVGFPPLAAVITALIGNSTAVTFGAVGVPITIGIAEGISGIFADAPTIVAAAARQTAFIHMFVGALVPLILSVSITFFFGRSLRKGLEIWPYAIFAGFCFTVPYYLTAIFWGPEFPSILGALIGGLIAISFTKKGFLVPKEAWDFPLDWKEDWGRPLQSKSESLPSVNVVKAVFPYLFVAALLLVTRLNVFGVGDYLAGLAFGISGIFATTVSHSLNIFYSPGFLFIITAFIFSYYFRIKSVERKQAFFKTLRQVKNPAIALIFIIGIVQILIFSGNNINDLPSIPAYLAGLVTEVGRAWIFVAPFVGALGSFIAGSSTVSNLLFSSLQAETALAVGLSPILILALQGVGSAVGNMIAIHNVVAALATVGVLGREGAVIRKNLIPVVAYLILASGLGFILFRFGA